MKYRFEILRHFAICCKTSRNHEPAGFRVQQIPLETNKLRLTSIASIAFGSCNPGEDSMIPCLYGR